MLTILILHVLPGEFTASEIEVLDFDDELKPANSINRANKKKLYKCDSCSKT
jgi:hypothetical protein